MVHFNVALVVQVLAYLCQYYNLHNTAVFLPVAEKHNDRIVQEFKLNKFFFGSKCQTVSRSNYSGRLTIQTAEVRPYNTLSLCLDQDKILACSTYLLQLSESKKTLEAAIATATEDLRQTEAVLETSRKDYQALERKRQVTKMTRGKLESLRQKQRGLLAAGSGVETERQQLLVVRQQAVCAQVTYATALAKTIGETGRVRLETEVKRLRGAPLQIVIDEQKEQLGVLQEEMAELRGEVAEAERELSESKAAMMDMLKMAKNASGVEPGSKDRPPTALREFWEQVRLLVQRIFH